MSFDIVSYVLGSKSGANGVVIEGGEDYMFEDTSNNGDIVMTKKEEVSNNG